MSAHEPGGLHQSPGLLPGEMWGKRPRYYLLGSTVFALDEEVTVAWDILILS